MGDGAIDPVVVMMVGTGRSGSTLFDRLLGDHEAVMGAGEVRALFTYTDRSGERCGCGEPYPSCPVWAPVVEEAFGGFDSEAFAEMAALSHRYNRLRGLLRLWRPASRKPAAEFAEGLWRTYRAVAHVTGSKVIVDTSKNPAHAFLARRAGGDALALVHLVRDSRAVAYSFTRRIERPDGRGEGESPRHRVWRSAVQWMLFHALCHWLLWRHPRGLRVRYEDLTGEPERQLDRIFGWLGVVRTPRTRAVTDHGISGNPELRGKSLGPVRPQEAWRTKMPRPSRLAVTVLTWPLLLRYGYLWRRRRA